MNYQDHYDRLISRAKERKLDCYTERHHIIPRCMNGTDDKNNLVQLTAREHFIAHLLLLKIYPKSYGLIMSLNMMCVSSKNHSRSMNRMYGWLKEKFSISQSINQKGEKNSQYGKMWIYNLELKENKTIPKGDLIPSGWLKGRIVNFDAKIQKEQEKEILSKEKKEKKKQKVEEIKIKNYKREENKNNRKDEIIKLFDKFKSGNFKSVSDFHKKENIIFSVMTLSNYWTQYIEEYKNNSKEGKPFRF